VTPLALLVRFLSFQPLSPLRTRTSSYVPQYLFFSFLATPSCKMPSRHRRKLLLPARVARALLQSVEESLPRVLVTGPLFKRRFEEGWALRGTPRFPKGFSPSPREVLSRLAFSSYSGGCDLLPFCEVFPRAFSRGTCFFLLHGSTSALFLRSFFFFLVGDPTRVAVYMPPFQHWKSPQ